MLRVSSISRWVVVSLTTGMAAVLGCGPFFPEDALDKPSGILQPPLFHFQSELLRLSLPVEVTGARQVAGTPAYTLDLEMNEMTEIISPLMPDANARTAWLARYRALRRAMIYQGDDSEQKMVQADTDATMKWDKALRDLQEVIAPLPQDVRLYLQGAAAWIDGREVVDGDSAQKAHKFWERLLALPPEQRPWRSTWAAWMMFRTTPVEQQGRWLNETRKLRQAGFKDALHLGIEATYILGRPASDYAERTEVSGAEWRRAAMLRAMLGLDDAAEKLRYDRKEFTAWSEELARDVIADPFLCRVQILNLVEAAESAVGWEYGVRASKGGTLNPDLEHWLASMESAGIKDQQGAVLLGWMFYNAAKFDQARRLLALAPADDVNALALRGKLAAMRGARREAEQQLTHLARLLPDTTDKARVSLDRDDLGRDGTGPLNTANYHQVRRHQFLADCGVAQVARNDFAGALQTFLRSDYWRDSAYIAERLLSVEELLALSRAGRLPRLEKPPPPPADAPPSEYSYGHWNLLSGMQPFTYLVARRLVREGYYKDAARLLPDNLADAVERYGEALRRGKNHRLPEKERGEALWTAAQIGRSLGLELFGFETAPDHAAAGGDHDLADFARLRARKAWTPWWTWRHAEVTEAEAAALRPVLPATADEMWRARHYAPTLDKRFHYRYTAAELGWKAAALMPDDEEQTARVLGIAGGWLKNKDPKAADRFYKALVRRNPSVPLAQEADRKRWFPIIDWDFDPMKVEVSAR